MRKEKYLNESSVRILFTLFRESLSVKLLLEFTVDMDEEAEDDAAAIKF